ncbi:MAG: capsule biosynthesis protein CapD [Rhodopirellula sp.]|nr:capsule biosynthesis protein CapD [Rhodopirellula sp.]
MKELKNFYIKYKKLFFLLLLYSFGSFCCYFISWQFRFDFNPPSSYRNDLFYSSIWIIPIKLTMLFLANQFSGLLAYFSIRDLIKLFFATTSSSLVVMLASFLLINDLNYIPPRGVVLIDYILSFMGLSGLRLMIRLYREQLRDKEYKGSKFLNVAIVGAGYAGSNIAKEMLMTKKYELKPVVFFDDDPSKINSQLHGIPILGEPDLILTGDFEYKLDKIIIALPSSAVKRTREIVQIANRSNIECEIIPSIRDIASGKIQISKLRKIQIQDLLQRDVIDLNTEKIISHVKNQTVLVTGAGGSIGSELSRQLANFGAMSVILVDRSEGAVFNIQKELQSDGLVNTVPIVADILDELRMDFIFKSFRPKIVFHAAAHKHVYLMENQPSEAIKNNTIGTKKLIDLSIKNNVSHFLLISTDKAINPTSVMGATKRLAEIYLKSVAASNVSRIKLMAVRFGNVLGSSGSVIPIFEEQISNGGPVTVTHPDVTRYFMTIPEAVGLVLQAGAQSNGGEIFVLDMGEPVKIVDLAKQLIELHGYNLGKNIEIKFIGLKPGEKLFEELSHRAENLAPTDHPKILRLISDVDKSAALVLKKYNYFENSHNMEPLQIKVKLNELIPEYKPYIE